MHGGRQILGISFVKAEMFIGDLRSLAEQERRFLIHAPQRTGGNHDARCPIVADYER